MLLATSLGLLALYVFYRLWSRNYSHWKDKGVPYLKGSFPFGTTHRSTTQGDPIGLVYRDLYERLEPHPYGGIYTMRRPILLLRDPEIIKHVLVKDFQHFRDRTRMNTTSTSPLSEHLFNLGGDKWRALRVKLTPTFSSGKLKVMFELFKKCSDQLAEVFQEFANRSAEVEIKEFVARFSTDIIGSCAFGVNVNSINEPNNDFTRFRKMIFTNQMSYHLLLRMALYNLLPNNERYVAFSRIGTKHAQALSSIVQGTVDFRERNGIKRNDFLDLLIDLKKGDSVTARRSGTPDVNQDVKLEMTMELLLAQCFVFFVAGFETSSSVMSFCLYELALNTEVQGRLREEIDDSIRIHAGLTYKGITEMAYLDQVVLETMRKYPMLQYLERVCTKDYKMPDSNAVINEGTGVIIPVHGLHHDPKYYPEPEVFDPDRFAPERKSSIPQYAFLPFGEGPRLCIGMRFGLLQTKMGICTLISKFRILPSPSTPTKLKLTPTKLVTMVKEPIKLRIENRT